MAESIKIEKPGLERFLQKRKLYFVRNLYLPDNPTDRYKELFNEYWMQVRDHASKLEPAGRVRRVFCESIYMTGEDAMKVLSAMNIHLEQLVQKKIREGAQFLPLEDREIFGAYIDWNNCLRIVRTQAVQEAVRKSLEEAGKARFEHIRSVLDQYVQEGESALLFMRDEDRKALLLPEDMELFLITPPAYDDLLKYVRDRDSGKEYWRT
jgi:hypothetical protein